MSKDPHDEAFRVMAVDLEIRREQVVALNRELFTVTAERDRLRDRWAELVAAIREHDENERRA